MFSDMFGPLHNPDLTLAQLPDGTLRDFAGPGLLLVSKRHWDPKGADRTISHLVAAQWWGNAVLPSTPGDVWISDGLARYCDQCGLRLDATAPAAPVQPAATLPGPPLVRTAAGNGVHWWGLSALLLVGLAIYWLTAGPGSTPTPAAGTGSALAVVLRGGRRIEVGRGFDTNSLEQLVRVLEGV